ncbi:MAG TPA: CapA family protein, partial [Chitinispirillaceae bacterium]|nr:CapA family protein [Chitinispirillaceae bacterium]
MAIPILSSNIKHLLILFLIIALPAYSKSSAYRLKIMGLGDIMTHISLLETIHHPSKGYDFNDIFKMVRPLISKADLVIANLETVMAGDSLGITGYPEFNSPQILAANLKNAGIDVLTTANNHSFDRGVKGLKNTIKLLDSLGIHHTGTHIDTSVSSRSLVLKVKNLKIGIISYCYGINGDLSARISKHINIIDTLSIQNEISYLEKQNVDLIIASVHFGVENRSQPDKSQISLVRFLQRNGVSIVLGHHPHVLQPYMFDSTANFFVIFSLGNFLSSQKSFNREFGGIADLVIRKTPHDKKACIESARIIPTT